MLRVSLYGAGQVSTNVAAVLAERRGVDVLGPFGRERRQAALCSGADVVVVATTSFLVDVADDVRDAVEAGSNVITTAEEAAYPWANDPGIATRLDALARRRGVSIVGAGLNPGFAFDALVLTVAGAAQAVDAIRVERVVDLSGFGETVLRRIGVGHTPGAFEEGVRSGAVTGHIGFPQSMQVVAGALEVEIERIERSLSPLVSECALTLAHTRVAAGETAGFEQRYLAVVSGEPWFGARFTGHVELPAIGLEPKDEIVVEGPTPLRFAAIPGLDPQSGSAAVVANSIRRIVAARPGWVTVAELPPAVPL